MKCKFYSIALSILISAFNISAFAADIDEKFHETFDVEKGDKLYLEHGDGDVTIIPWDKDIIDIKVHYSASNNFIGIGKRTKFDVEFSQQGNEVRVIEKETHSVRIGIGNFHENEYTYKIYAPDYMILDLNGEDGDVYIEDWTGETSIHLSDGEIELENLNCKKLEINIEDGDLKMKQINGELLVDSDDGDIYLDKCVSNNCRLDVGDGDIKIRQAEGTFEIESDDGNIDIYDLKGREFNISSNDGDIKIRKSKGDFEIKSDDGDIDIKDLLAQKLYITTNDGDVEAELLKTENVDIDVRADDGRITLEIEKGISAEVTINTDDGRIKTDLFDIEDFDREENWLRCQMLDGKGKIRIRTNDGDVILREIR